MFRNKVRTLHLIGIGGSGMSGIAQVLHTMGFVVHGSDLQRSAAVQHLQSLGITIHVGHRSEHIAQADVVVVSSAIGKDNVECLAAKARGIPVIPRAEMLAELMRLKQGIAIAGMHGKTTTTSLIATILTHANLDPTLVLGGRLKSISANARLGQGELLIAEADESDGSFLRLFPTIGVVTNIDKEHTDYWRGGMEQIRQAFATFLDHIPFYGLAVVAYEGEHMAWLRAHVDKRLLTYGLDERADLYAHQIQLNAKGSRFHVVYRGEDLGPIELPLLGHHNIRNALAAMGVALEVGVAFPLMQQALTQFTGIGRRFEWKGEHQGIIVVDDYGHHPTEIEVTLRAARQAYPHHRLVVVFQPHRYSRTHALWDQFVTAFADCDCLYQTAIYSAGEAPIQGVDGQAFWQAIASHSGKPGAYLGELDQVATQLVPQLQPGDVVLTLGAGSIAKLGEQLLEQLAQHPQPLAQALAVGS